MLPSYFKKTLNVLASPLFYTKYLILLTGATIPSKIHCNPRFFPYFQHAIGAINGSHIPVSSPANLHVVYHN